MAQSTNVQPIADSTVTETDDAAWIACAKSRKFDVDNGEVLGFTDGRVMRLKAPAGFAALPAGSRLLVFAATTQYVLTRVGQTATGNIQDAIDKAFTDGEISDAKGYGAREQAYRDGILDLIVEKIDADFKLTVKGDPVKTAENRKNFEATVEKQRPTRFDTIVAAARANVMREAGETKTRKAAPKGTSFEL